MFFTSRKVKQNINSNVKSKINLFIIKKNQSDFSVFTLPLETNGNLEIKLFEKKMDDPELIRLDTPTKDLWPPKNIDELDVEIEEVSDEEEEPEEEEQVKFDT